MPIRSVIEHWLALDEGWPDEPVIEDDRDFFRKVTDWALLQSDTNPVLVWTLGVGGNYSRPALVRQWSLAQVDVDQFYSNGVNSRVNPLLESCRSNIKSLYERFPHLDEFECSSWPEDQEKQILIGVEHPGASSSGTVELIDGIHRLFGAIRSGVGSVPTYLARLR